MQSKGGMGSLKMSFLSSFKELEDYVHGEGEGLEGGAGSIPQLNAGLGQASTKMGLVVAYKEKGETLPSITKQKVRRMMHYQVSPPATPRKGMDGKRWGFPCPCCGMQTAVWVKP
jgi:hypothetical protein